MRARSHPVVLGLAAVLLVPVSLAAGAPAPTTPYRHPGGFTFSLPSGWSVEKGEGGAVLLLPKDRDPLEVLLVTEDSASGIASARDPRVVQEVEKDLLPLFPFLARAGSAEAIPTGLGSGVRLAWEGNNPAGILVRAETYVVLRGGRAMALLAVGPRDRIAARAATLRRLFAGFGPEGGEAAPRFEFSKAAFGARQCERAKRGRVPALRAGGARSAKAGSTLLPPGTGREATLWRQRLSGKKLTYMSSYSSGSSGGYNSRYDLYLDPSGRFVYRGSSSVSVYVPGANGTGIDQEAREGTWRIFTRGGQAILEVVPAGEKAEQFALTSQDGKTFLNGTRVFVTDP